MVLEGSRHLSKSLDSLNLLDNTDPPPSIRGSSLGGQGSNSFKGSIRGSVVPDNRKESMRSYKSGGAASGRGSGGSGGSGGSLFGGDGDVMMIGSSVKAASEKGSEVASDVLDSVPSKCVGLDVMQYKLKLNHAIHSVCFSLIRIAICTSIFYNLLINFANE